MTGGSAPNAGLLAAASASAGGDDSGAGVNYARRGDLPAARKHFEAALAKNPDDATALNNLAYVAGEAGNTDEAVRLLREALEVSPRCVECANNLGVLLGRAGRRTEARIWLARALEWRPAFVDAELNLAVLDETESSWKSALDRYRRAEAKTEDAELKQWLKFRVAWLGETVTPEAEEGDR